ncbi:MAG: stage II sporulation protein M [Acidimicrobiia bacterium]|nr:stage II sporulation protein M [Acidimicrobiia bacterium]MDH5238455.1 stage II sporulation protein M [Acidimicrobiia bacterium]
MDIDRYIAAHEGTWSRLQSVSARARTGLGSMEPADIDELIALYQQASTHLSYVRTHYRDPALVGRLTMLVGDARAQIYSTRSRSTRSLSRFFTELFPAAVWQLRWFMAASAAWLLVPALIVGVWIANSDEALEATGSEALRQAYVEEDFEAYYSSEAAGLFSAQVLINNIQVSFLAFALGFTFGVGTVAVLAFNGVNAGTAAGLFYAADQEGKFWGLILPHGLLELTAVIVAGGAGLALGWAVIDPGDRPRVQALAEEGRRTATVVLGLMLAFVVAGLIEGFVTPSSLPTTTRIAIGVLAVGVFLAWILGQGPAAEARGVTGHIATRR